MSERIAALASCGTYDSLRVLMAFAKGTGVGLVSDALEAFVQSGGDVEVIVGLDMDGTTPDALESLIGIGATVHAFGIKGDRTFHPKVMIFDTEPRDEFAAIVGSNNWTPGGLDSNFEVALEVSGRRSESPEAEALGLQLEELWKTYRDPLPPLEADKHLKAVTSSRVARWSGELPETSSPAAPDQRQSTLSERVFEQIGTQLPRKPLRRPPRRGGGAASSATPTTSPDESAATHELPDKLYLVVTGAETDRGREIQIPTEALRDYFGVAPNDSFWVTFQHADGEVEKNRKVGVYSSNKTYRLSSGKFASVPRPFVLELGRVAADTFDVKFHLAGSTEYTTARAAATHGGGISKSWGTA